MRETVAEANAAQSVFGLLLIGDAVEVLREHDVFQRGKIRNEMKLLEDEAYFFRTITNQLTFGALGKVNIIDDDAAGSESVQAAENIDQSGFAGTGWAHERDPFAGIDGEADVIESAQWAVLLDQGLDHNLWGVRTDEFQGL